MYECGFFGRVLHPENLGAAVHENSPPPTYETRKYIIP
jgi:hypothetical protein